MYSNDTIEPFLIKKKTTTQDDWFGVEMQTI